jgi:hypothetical protein
MSLTAQPEALDASKFKFASWGIVANNKAMSENTIQVTPIEQLTMLDGELGSIPTEQEAEGQDASGQSYTSKVTSDTAVEADWLPGLGAGNRVTSPDVRRGERVMLFQYADDDKYYWTSLGLDNHLRKLETVIYSWSATTDEAVDGTTDGNCYSLEVSTHAGQITLKTSTKNGEHCMYAIQIDAKNGRVMMVDDIDNEFVFDSKNTHLWMKNADGTLMELNKKQFHVYAPDDIFMEAVNSILMKTKDFRIECNDYKLISQTFRTECSTGSFKGTYTFEDPVTFNNTTTFGQKITANGIQSSAPIVGPSDTI